MIGKYYLQNRGIQNMRISFQSEIGGGDTTSIRLANIIDEGQRICLCIADSDMRYCGAKNGGTLEKILAVAKAREQIHYEVYALKMHEIENLIPVELLESVCKEIPDACEGIQFLKKMLLIDDSDNSPVYYFDYKKGIKREYFFLKEGSGQDEEKKFRKLEDYRKYWRSVLNQCGIILNEDANDFIVPGVCGRILNHTIKYLKSKWEEDKVCDIVSDSYIHESWMEIGAKIVTWGCVGRSFL